MDWMIEHLGPSLTAGILVFGLALVAFGLLALTPLWSMATGIGYAIATGAGMWLGNAIGRAMFK